VNPPAAPPDQPLATAEDTVAAAALTHAFFAGLDLNDPDAVAACMAPDGVWVRQGTELKGPEAVRQACAARPRDRATAHVISNLTAWAAGEGRMRVRFYLSAYLSAHKDGGWSAPSMPGVRWCTDDLVRTPAGWRIARKDSRALLPPA